MGGSAGVHPSQLGFLLAGWGDGMAGRPNVAAPEGWEKAFSVLDKRPEAETRLAAMRLAQVFATPDVSGALRALADDSSNTMPVRAGALDAWAARPRGDLQFLLGYLGNDDLAEPALRAIGTGADLSLAQGLVAGMPKAAPRARQGILGLLVGRKAWARVLVDALESKAIDHRELPAHLARQIAELKDPALTERLEKSWGSIQPISGDRKQMLERWRGALSPEVIAKGDSVRGKALSPDPAAYVTKCLVREGTSVQTLPVVSEVKFVIGLRILWILPRLWAANTSAPLWKPRTAGFLLALSSRRRQHIWCLVRLRRNHCSIDTYRGPHIHQAVHHARWFA